MRILFWLYITLIICATLIFFRGAPYHSLELNPIASYRRALAAPPTLAKTEIRNIILNILMFVPLGFSLPFLWSPLQKFHFVLLISLTFTLSIETTQLITAQGVFSLEDIAHNTLGAALGYFMFTLIKHKLTLDKSK